MRLCLKVIRQIPFGNITAIDSQSKTVRSLNPSVCSFIDERVPLDCTLSPKYNVTLVQAVLVEFFRLGLAQIFEILFPYIAEANITDIDYRSTFQNIFACL